MVKKLKNFRIDESKWIKFQKWCAENNTNASQSILDYIDGCIDKGYQEQESHLQGRIDDCRDKVEVNFEAMSRQKEQIKQLKIRVQKLEEKEKKLDKFEENLAMFVNALDSLRRDNDILKFNLLTKRELQRLARDNNLENSSDLTKDKLIDVLLENNIFP